MSYPDVLRRGEDFLSDYPRTLWWWNYASHATCFGMIMGSKFLLNVLYKPEVHHVDKLDAALARARAENRALLTVMNHMLVVDDPCFYAALPLRFHTDIDTIRWGFGAHNICFSNAALSWFFNLGRILGTKRFGEGPFQGSIDAAIRILSPDDTLDLEFSPGVKAEQPTLIQEVNGLKAPQPARGLFSSLFPQPDVHQLVKKVAPSAEAQNVLMRPLPFIRTKTSWFHVFPEGFVLQLEEPYNNSMRYFKWGVARLVLEATRAPIVMPIFAYGFEKIAPENAASEGIKRWLPSNLGAEVHITFGDPIDDEKIEGYRAKWRKLVKRFADPKNPNDMPERLRSGKEAQALRSDIAADLRDAVLAIRETTGHFRPEDPRFRSPAYWKEYTNLEGMSDPAVKFIGQNWAIKRLQKHLHKE